MNTKIIFFALVMTTLSAAAQLPTIYNIPVKGIDGKPIQLADYKGKKILIVNVASECGYTPQYADLQKLYELYKDKLVVIGLPCNDFGGQEPGSEEKIQQFCTSKYNVTFPMGAKVNIKAKPQSPIYEWLTKKSLNGVEDSEVNWNFNKYLIDENGHYVAHFKSGVKPLSDELLAAIKK
jgi:glutathione peroxidase